MRDIDLTETDRRVERNEIINNTASFISHSKSLYKSLGLSLYWLSFLIFVISQTILVGVVWAMLVGIFIHLVHKIAYFLMGPTILYVFFFIFTVLTFVLGFDATAQEQVGKWIKTQPEIISQFSVNYNQNLHYGNEDVALQNLDGKLYSKCLENWAGSNSYHFCQDNGIDTDKIMRKAFTDFEKWVIAGHDGIAPIPTPEFMEEYCKRHAKDNDVKVTDP